MIITLRPYDTDTPAYKLTSKIVTLPKDQTTISGGALYKINENYVKHGSNHHFKTQGEAPLGSTALPYTLDTSVSNRVVYGRVEGERRDTSGVLDVFTYTVDDGTSTSLPGTITILSESSKKLVSSSFDSNDENWKIEGNRLKNSVNYENSSRGKELNHYVFGTDDSITSSNTDSTSPDTSLWRFVAPEKFHGNWATGYNGNLKFTVSSFSGDFSTKNLNYDTTSSTNSLTNAVQPNTSNHLVKIHCKTCKVNTGVTIAYPFPQDYTGKTKVFDLLMNENNWLIDPETSLTAWSKPTKCEFLEVLSSISSLSILGDFTRWYESIAIDDVILKVADNKKGGVPICGQKKPDASDCTCV